MARRSLEVGALGSLVLLLGAAAIAGCGSSGGDDDDGDDTGGDSGLHADGGSDATTGTGGGDAGGDATTTNDGSTGGDSGDATTGSGNDAGDGSSGDSGGSEGGADSEAGLDAGADAAIDSGHDSGPDAGPTATLHYYGRFDTTDSYQDPGLGVTVTATAAAPVFDWSGSGIVTSFTGTGIAVILTAYPYSEGMGFNEMQIVVDGTAVSPTSHGLVLSNGGACSNSDVCAGTYTLASGLKDATHTIELYKRTEANYGYIQFGGFKNVAGGSADWALVATPDPYPRKLEFIGDSITAGYGVLGTYPCPPPDDDGDVNDAYQSFAGQAARDLGASFVGIAFSGKGAYQDSSGKTTPADPELPALYPQTLDNWSNSSYNFATQMDAVVINLGTNDYNQGYDPAGFVPAYEGLVATVRLKYPKAYILLIDGPLLSNSYPFANAYDQLDTDLTTIVTHFKNTTGDTNMGVLEVPIQGDCSQIACGCDEHPTVSEDQSIASLVAAKIKAAKGW